MVRLRGWSSLAAHFHICSLDFSPRWCTLFPAGEFRLGEKQVKKTLATLVLMGLPAVTLATRAAQNTPQQDAAPTTSGSSSAKSHHSSHHKHSKNSHHKTRKHHTSKQHPQAQ